MGDSHSDAVQERLDREKAQALDAAIAFEDGEVETSNEQPITAVGGQDKECHMIDFELVKKLNAAGDKLNKAWAELVEVCGEIAEAAKTGDSPAATEKRARTGRRGGRHIEAPGDPAADAAKQYWRKVKCPVCHAVMGSRVFKDVRYPILHKSDDGSPCKGSFQAGLDPE